jgi:hypothetical protein
MVATVLEMGRLEDDEGLLEYDRCVKSLRKFGGNRALTRSRQSVKKLKIKMRNERTNWHPPPTTSSSSTKHDTIHTIHLEF